MEMNREGPSPNNMPQRPIAEMRQQLAAPRSTWSSQTGAGRAAFSWVEQTDQRHSDLCSTAALFEQQLYASHECSPLQFLAPYTTPMIIHTYIHLACMIKHTLKCTQVTPNSTKTLSYIFISNSILCSFVRRHTYIFRYLHLSTMILSISNIMIHTVVSV